jgi:hypothetical protein
MALFHNRGVSMKIFGLSAVLTGALAFPVMGCDLCSVSSAEEANGESGRGIYAGLAEQYTYFGTVQDNGHKIPNEGVFIKSSVSQVFTGYRFSDRLGLQLNLPMIYRSFALDPVRHDSEWGLGDVSLVGNFIAYQKLDEDFAFRWSVLGGLKLPTGDTHFLGVDDEVLNTQGIGGHDLALGSGSVDGITGTGVSARWKRTFLTANAQYAIRTEGDFHHQYANDITWWGGPGYFVALEKKWTLSLQAMVSGEHKGKDTFNGVPDGDSAETIVYLGPQISFTWGSKLSAQIGADLPLSIYNSGVQLVPDYRVRGAVTWRF